MTAARFAPIAKRTLATVADAAPAQAQAVRPAFGSIRHDWRRSEIQKIFDAPLMETIFKAVR
jgi:biotin synthase